MHIKIGGWKHSYWHTFSFHPHVYAHLSHNRLYLREILGLYTIDIWTAVCVFEQWALRTDHMLYENWRSGACARESTSISAIPPIPALINNELWLPGKTGHLVTQSLTLWVLRPLFQIASLRFGCVSVPWDTERVLRTLPCYAAARLSHRFSQSNLRRLGECPHFIARCPAHSGGFWQALQS